MSQYFCYNVGEPLPHSFLTLIKSAKATLTSHFDLDAGDVKLFKIPLDSSTNEAFEVPKEFYYKDHGNIVLHNVEDKDEGTYILNYNGEHSEAFDLTLGKHFKLTALSGILL